MRWQEPQAAAPRFISEKGFSIKGLAGLEACFQLPGSLKKKKNKKQFEATSRRCALTPVIP